MLCINYWQILLSYNILSENALIDRGYNTNRQTNAVHNNRGVREWMRFSLPMIPVLFFPFAADTLRAMLCILVPPMEENPGRIADLRPNPP